MRCRRIGWIAVNMKNNQKRSPIDMWATPIECSGSWATRSIEAELTLVGIIGAIAWLGLTQRRAQKEADDETTYMSPPRHSTTGAGHEQLGGSLQDLKQKPDSDKYESVNFEEERNEDDWYHHDDPRQGEKTHIAPKHAGNCAGCPQHRNL